MACPSFRLYVSWLVDTSKDYGYKLLYEDIAEQQNSELELVTNFIFGYVRLHMNILFKSFVGPVRMIRC